MTDERRDAKAKPAEAPASFEQAIQRLGEIVHRLEAGELTLEESLAAFERGVSLARDAQRRLDAAESRVEELLGVDEQGRPVTRPIEGRTLESRPTAPESPAARTRPDPRPARTSAAASAAAPVAASPAVRRDPEAPLPDDDDMPF